MKDLRKVKILYSLLAAAQIILGICLLVCPENFYMKICKLLGGLLIVYGIVKIISYFTKDRYQLAFQFDLAMGTFSLILGIFLTGLSGKMFSLFPTLIGILILTDAVFKVQTSWDARCFGMNKWWFILIIALLAGAAGLLLIAHSLDTVEFIMLLTGINLITDGFLNLWGVVYTVKA